MVSRSTSEGQTHALVDVVADELRRRDREDRVELLEGALLGLGQEEEETDEREDVEAPEVVSEGLMAERRTRRSRKRQ